MEKPDAPEKIKYRAKKDRKRWCKGKVGVKHDFPEPVNIIPHLKGIQLWQSVCTNCGKKDLEFRK